MRHLKAHGLPTNKTNPICMIHIEKLTLYCSWTTPNFGMLLFLDCKLFFCLRDRP